jgi:peptidoglycan hydrolase CwlO-like protein
MDDYTKKLEEENKRLNQYIISLEDTVKKLKEQNENQEKLIMEKRNSLSNNKETLAYEIERVKAFNDRQQKAYEEFMRIKPLDHVILKQP